jgi:hypothetical protein
VKLSARSILFAAGFGFIAAAGWADTIKDASFDVKPGEYHWQQATSVGGIPVNQDKTQCLKEEKAHMTLSDVARRLDKGCAVDDVAKVKGGYAFKLICSGKYPGTADAKLISTDKSFSLEASGSAKLLGMMAPFTAKADASYVGECTPEELAKPDKSEKN